MTSASAPIVQASDSAGTVHDRITTPMDDSGFARVLGLKVSRWADEGVERAWLEVHPADMGPVSIQIAVEGQQARLDFASESAAARQIIQSALPELAAALQSAGLTLSGGGIFQQLGQQDRREASSPEDTLGRDGGLTAATVGGSPGSGAVQDLRRTGSPRGLLDAYA